MGRLLCRLAAVVLLCVGCASAPGPLKKLSNPLSGGSLKDRSLRKQVDADSFPTAKQAGLSPTAPE